MASEIGSEAWLRERFPDKDWHWHLRTDGRTDMCDGTPSDCTSRPRIEDLLGKLLTSLTKPRAGERRD